MASENRGAKRAEPRRRAACIEDDAVRQRLATLGCDLIQGYLIARPMPLEDLKHRLQLPSAA